MSYTAKITSKGQVTVPKPIRRILNTDIVEFDIREDCIEMRPVRPAAGSLKRYAQPDRISEESLAWKRMVDRKREDG